AERSAWLDDLVARVARQELRAFAPEDFGDDARAVHAFPPVHRSVDGQSATPPPHLSRQATCQKSKPAASPAGRGGKKERAPPAPRSDAPSRASASRGRASSAGGGAACRRAAPLRWRSLAQSPAR